MKKETVVNTLEEFAEMQADMTEGVRAVNQFTALAVGIAMHKVLVERRGHNKYKVSAVGFFVGLGIHVFFVLYPALRDGVRQGWQEFCFEQQQASDQDMSVDQWLREGHNLHAEMQQYL